MFTSDQWQQLLTGFIEEARDLLQQAESALLDLDQGGQDKETIHSLFRAVHTLKGSAGLFGLDGFVRFAHGLESFIMPARDGGLVLLPAHITSLLRGMDVLSGEIERLAAGEEPADLAAVHADVLAALKTDGGAIAVAAAEHVERIEPSSEPANWHISLRLAPDFFRYGFDPASFLRYLGRLGELCHVHLLDGALPTWDTYDPEQCYFGLEFDLRTPASKTEIESAFDLVHDLITLRILPPDSRLEDYLALIADAPEDAERLGEILIASGLLTAQELKDGLARQQLAGGAARLGEVLVEDGVVPPPAVDAALARQQEIRNRRQGDSGYLKVSAQKMDELINLVGELVIAAAGAELQARLRNDSDLVASASAINRNVEQIREVALRLRMVEIGETFNRFNRLVRDSSQELGKQILLRIQGADTELDKTVVDRIAEPLTHLVRNAIDHGIEPVEKRLQQGKSGQGVITLSACHESGNILIEVRDDGAGLDAMRIRAKAVAKGLIADDAELSERAIYQLIFEPGFSTAEAVSNLSGRGVGMDVVRRNVEALRGSIEIESVQGAGCAFRVRLPLTLAIIEGFLVQVGDCPLVIPLDMVTECLAIEDPGDLAAGYRELRGKPLPLVDMRQHLALAGEPSRRQSVVVVRQGQQQVGLVVDHLLGEQQIVLKPLGSLFEHLRDISGSTILGSGQVALVVDVPGMLSHLADLRLAAPTH